jgi:hypothetical protein
MGLLLRNPKYILEKDLRIAFFVKITTFDGRGTIFGRPTFQKS